MLEFGEERGARDRSEYTFDRQEWRNKDPFELVESCIESLEESSTLTSAQREWISSAVYRINIKHYNPIALVVGFVALKFETKEVTERTFRAALRCADRFKGLVQLRNTDVLRYARRWETWCKENLF